MSANNGAATVDPQMSARGRSIFISTTNFGSSTGAYPAKDVIVVPGPSNGFPCLYVWDVPVFPATKCPGT